MRWRERRHEALRQYQALVDVLSAELGLAPEPETTALYAQIVSVSLSAHLPILVSPSHLTVAASRDPRGIPFVGRRAGARPV
jgi:DNA-binding SARP family transcriptional activator